MNATLFQIAIVCWALATYLAVALALDTYKPPLVARNDVRPPGLTELHAPAAPDVVPLVEDAAGPEVGEDLALYFVFFHDWYPSRAGL